VTWLASQQKDTVMVIIARMGDSDHAFSASTYLWPRTPTRNSWYHFPKHWHSVQSHLLKDWLHFKPKIPHHPHLCSLLRYNWNHPPQKSYTSSPCCWYFALLKYYSYPISSVTFLRSNHNILLWNLMTGPLLCVLNSSFKNFAQGRHMKVVRWFRHYWKWTWISIHSSNHSSLCVFENIPSFL
jgi:hypothetical protein